jgi:hypothetical protein
MLPRQCHCQHDSATTTQHNQRCLGSATANIGSAATSRHDQHRLGSATTNVTLVVPSPARLDNDVTPRSIWIRQRHNQRCLDSIIVSMTCQRQRATANVALTAPLPTMAWQHHRWHDSRAQCVLPRLAIRLGGSPPIRLGGLRSTTSTDSPTRVHFHLHR